MALADSLAAAAREHDRLGDHAEAIALAHRALKIYEAHAHLEGEALVLRIIGTAQSRTGSHGQALEALERSVALDRHLGDVYWEVHALEKLAVLYTRTGRPGRPVPR